MKEFILTNRLQQVMNVTFVLAGIVFFINGVLSLSDTEPGVHWFNLLFGVWLLVVYVKAFRINSIKPNYLGKNSVYDSKFANIGIPIVIALFAWAYYYEWFVVGEYYHIRALTGIAIIVMVAADYYVKRAERRKRLATPEYNL